MLVNPLLLIHAKRCQTYKAMKLQKPKTTIKGIFGTIILIGILFLFFKSCFNSETPVKEQKEEKITHVIGFESLPRVMIGNGSMGALAGIVHGWKEENWDLMTKYISEKDRIGTEIEESEFLESILKSKKLIGFKIGEIDKRSPFNNEYKNCKWTIINEKKDTISFITTERMFAEKGNQSEWCTYFSPLNYVGKK